eukprot:gene5066-7070_t
MTTYNGRSASYIPGKEVVNKEPPVSRYVVEKLYRVHRERVLKVEPTVDCHVHVPDFLKNQSWKKQAQKHKEDEIVRHNHEIFGRIARAEKSESGYAKENREHLKRIESKSRYMKKLREEGRLRQIIKIQKENEFVLKRIEKAKPEYTLKSIKDWYKHHEVFKAGRRSDPTSGHIMHNMKGLMPGSLPPISQEISSLDRSMSLNTVRKSRSSKISEGILGSSAPGMSADSFSRDRSSSIAIAPISSSVDNNRRATRSAIQIKLTTESNRVDEDGEDNSPADRTTTTDNSNELVFNQFGGKRGSVVQFEEAPSLDKEFGEDDLSNTSSMDTVREDLSLITSRSFPNPLETRFCTVHIYSSKTYDENLYIKVFSAGMNPILYSERPISIDKAYEIVNSDSSSSHLMQTNETDDLVAISSLLINMFKEADVDDSGSLTFDEFQSLMEKVELGISPQELRFVISEADENDNGLVDYNEFVPLAIDLIQSFRARNQAKSLNSQQDIMVDDIILKSISTTEIDELTVVCLKAIGEVDSKHYGLIRPSDLKKCLQGVATAAGGHSLRETEISMICKMLPRDQFGRCKYSNPTNIFHSVLGKVRFMMMKNSILESKGSGLQKYILDLCKEEEAKIQHDNKHYKNASLSATNSLFQPSEKFVPTGIIPCRSLINILTTSKRLSLSRLQVLVIMSEALVLDGMINYYQFIPVVAKAIELMFEPKALRQRAELIEKTDLSPEALLNGMSSEMFEQRLLTLFKSYDIDRSGGLDQNEFIACLDSLELELTYGEMVALMAQADIHHYGFLQFEDFVQFFTRNLLNLEREKHIRLLQNSMSTKQTVNNNTNEEEFLKEQYKLFVDRLNSIFKLSDKDNTGFIPYDEFESVLRSFSTDISKILLEVMLSELHMDHEGLVNYQQATVICADLLTVYRAKKSAAEEEKRKEEWAEQKAIEIAQSSMEDINHIVRYIRLRMRTINDSQVDPERKMYEIQHLLRNPHTGLARNEANILITKLFMGSQPNTPAVGGDFDKRKTSQIHVATDATFQALNQSSVSRVSSNDTNSNSNSNNNSPSIKTSTNRRVSSMGNSRDLIEINTSTTGTNNTNNNNLILNSINNRHRNSFDLSSGVMVTPTNRAGRASHVRYNMRAQRTNFSTEELTVAVFEARRISIMRGLLENIDESSLRAKITKLLEDEFNKDQPMLSDEHSVSIDSIDSTGSKRVIVGANKGHFLPVKQCFHVLGKAHDLRLNHAQIMFITSLAECFSNDGLFLELYKFAEHCASIISKMHLPESLETRAEVLQQGTIHHNNLMNGLKESDLESYLQSQFSLINAEDGRMSQDDFYNILKNIPKVNLSDRETISIVAGFHGHHHSVKWKDIIPSTISSIQALCRERMIHRRVTLLVTTRPNTRQMTANSDMSEAKRLQNESMLHLKQIAEKLFTYVRLARGEAEDTILIQLTIEDDKKNGLQLEDVSSSVQGHSITQLYRGAKILPMETIIFRTNPSHLNNNNNRISNFDMSKQNSMAVINSNGTIAAGNSNVMSRIGSRATMSNVVHHNNTAPSFDVIKSEFPVLFRVVAMEELISMSPHKNNNVHNNHDNNNTTAAPANNITLAIHLNDISGKYFTRTNLAVRLPTIALVDVEAAEQFAKNLIEKMYIEDRLDIKTLKFVEES